MVNIIESVAGGFDSIADKINPGSLYLYFMKKDTENHRADEDYKMAVGRFAFAGADKKQIPLLMYECMKLIQANVFISYTEAAEHIIKAIKLI